MTIPLTILEGPREAYIEILHQPERGMVAALELLTPAQQGESRPNRIPGETPGQLAFSRRSISSSWICYTAWICSMACQRRPLKEPLPQADYYYYALAE